MSLAILAGLALLAAACGGEPAASGGGGSNDQAAEGGAGSGLETITVLSAGEGIQYMMPPLASELGYFQEEGVEVAFADSAAGGGDATAALTGGDVDIIQTGLPHVIATNSQGLNLRAIAPSIEQYSLSVVVGTDVMEELAVAADASAVEKVTALAERGARIGISSPGSSTDIFMRHLCQEAEVSCDGDIELIALGGIGESIAAFEQRQIDGLVRSHPDVDQAMQAGDGTLLISGAAGDVPTLEGYLYVTMVTTDDRIEDKREELLAYLRAVGKAMRFVQEKPEEAKTFAKEYAGPDVEQALWSAAWDASYDALPADVVIEPAGVEKTFEVVEALDPGAVGVEPDAVYDVELAKETDAAIADWTP